MLWRSLTVQLKRASVISNVQRQARAISTTPLFIAAGECSGNDQSSWNAGVLAIGVALGSFALATASKPTLCDAAEPTVSQRSNEVQRFVSKGGVRDPMTTYQQYAMARERKLSAGQESTAGPESSATDSTSSVQATSATSEPMAVSPSAASLEVAPPPPPPQPASPDDTPGTSMEMSQAELRFEEAARKAKQHSGGLKIFSGNGNMSLALEIARHLGVNLGKATVGKFADGEVNVVIHENVRGKDVYVVQPTCPPVNDNIMELLLIVSTLRRSSARRITVVIPYYGYARQDRKMQVRKLAFSILRSRPSSPHSL
jgi:N-terminal domain of ribose phosphate pyrophosphokinase